LAKKFERAIPFCIAAVLNFTDSDQLSVVVNLYLHTRGVAISDKFCELAKKMFCNYELKFVDLEHEELGDYFMPRSSESERNFEEMANIAQIIEKNLPYFINRSNVTAVYPSYKISNHQETDDLCIAVSVVGKGKIPVGEEVFPERLGDYPLDVVQGYVLPTCRFEYDLRSGVGIGVRGMAGTGTLGAFLTDGHDYYLLSCNHVLFKQDGALTAEQTLGDKKADEKKSREEKPAETGESESVVKPQTAELDFMEKIRAADKKIEELRKKDNLEPDAITELEAGLGMLMVRDAISDAMKRLETAESDSVEEQRLTNCTSDDANSKIIGRLKSQIRVPKEGEILIEHPAKEDVIAEVSKCMEEREKNIKTRQDVLKKNRGEESNTTRTMKFAIEAAKSRLDELLDEQLPRCIATYVGGYQDNFSYGNNDIFVDAGIAKLCDDQRDEILAGNCKPYAKGIITGEVMPWEEIRKEPEGTKFWKSGAKTGLTEEGKFIVPDFKFKDTKFSSTFCGGCAENMRCVSFEFRIQETCVCKKCQREIAQTETKQEIFARDCFLVKRKREDFSADGDSGAVIFDEKNRAWGIIVGVFLVGDSSFSVVCSLDIALQALREKTGKPSLRLWPGVAGN
jgi:hypothetical protein